MLLVKGSAVRQITKKRINWYGSVTVHPAIAGVRIFPRVESLTHRVLENNVLQVQATIKLFAVAPPATDLPGQNGQGLHCFSSLVDTTTFIRLRPLAHSRDILSIRHEVGIEKTTMRPGRISVIGRLDIEVEYLSPVSLNGRVTAFATGQPVAGAKVQVLDMEQEEVLYETTTAADGSYAFEGIDAGTYRVRVQASHYEPREEIAVLMLQDTVNFVLHRRVDQKDVVAN
ncbi:carboxypeptidase-like regulatory domain-containing protein [Desulfofundulus thermosubterraneus]|uniref:carboxypeptidase-like regulatory domain-containing protein n=1 Tax=Desulfofundulus thermosubterraneus TaxID=348840 RepID=UPI000A046F15|nr:carboxypeptidase-like regulatory domain-containing protein [Desulfofundulus thermosubterraneus]